ncbi:MAG: low molecular weight phosphotyrosine protein phosphatase [Anaerolineaceae bacterium]|nr:low molecular weight phosphotyrosine protein phosphatase [Anaerolineaceae bacterium]
MNKDKIGVMFVCLGNICRSPMAEAVFTHLVEERGLSERFKIQSSGVGPWHVGERPHPGTIQVLRQHDMAAINGKRAQQIKSDLFTSFDYVIAMDTSNQSDLKRLGNATLLLDEIVDGEVKDVPDPYYERNFNYVFELVKQGCSKLLDRICQEQGLG